MLISAFEAMHAGQAGFARALRARLDGRALEEGRSDFGFERDILGAISEYVVAKALNVCWSPAVGRLDLEGDLPGIGVKSTTRPNGSLILRPQDIDESVPYVLVITETILRHRIAGWFHGTPDDRYWREVDRSTGVHQAAFFIPQADLRPFDTFDARGALV